MKRFNKFAVTLGLSFIICSCSCGKSKDNVVSNNTTKTEEDKIRLAYEYLCKLAYNELVGLKSINTNLEWKSYVTAIRYINGSASYSALVKIGDKDSYVVEVEMNYGFQSSESFVRRMSNLNLSTAKVVYNTDSDYKKVCNDKNIEDKMDKYLIKTPFDISKQSIRLIYEYEAYSSMYSACLTYFDKYDTIYSDFGLFCYQLDGYGYEDDIYYYLDDEGYLPDDKDNTELYKLLEYTISNYNV